MTAIASTDVTVTVLDTRFVSPREVRNKVRIVFGNSTLTYPPGGVPMPSDASFGLRSPLRKLLPIQDRNTTSAAEWQHDPVANTLRGYQVGAVPYLIVDEAVTLTSNAGTLAYPPAYITGAVATVSAASKSLKPVPATATLATLEMGVNWTTGAVTTFSSDSASALQVSYIPQQPAGPFSFANMVVDEVITLSTSGVNLAFRAAALQYVYQTAATAKRQAFAHAAATDKMTVAFNNSGNTTITAAAGNDAKAAVATYLKYSAFPNPAFTWTAAATISLTSQAKEYGKTAGDRVGGYVIPACGVSIIGVEATNFLEIGLGSSTITAGVGLAKWDPVIQKITTAETTAQTSIQDIPLLYLQPLLMPHRAMAEFNANMTPSPTTLYFEAVA